MPIHPSTLIRRSIAQGLAAVQAAEAELGQLDAVAGDGDHGITMVRGMTAAVAALEATPEQATAGELLVTAGMAFADAAGGASGALFGMFMSSTGQKLGHPPYSGATVAEAVKMGLTMVSKLGKAKPGDKTFIDTLDPFANALAAEIAGGAALTAAWQTALAAAEAGAASTAQMSASRGRSAKHGDRSLGHRDPGAVSMLYLLQSVGKAMADA